MTNRWITVPAEANIHKLDDEATERLAEDQKDLSRQQGVESLHATQAKLLEKNGTIDITPTVLQRQLRHRELTTSQQITSLAWASRRHSQRSRQLSQHQLLFRQHQLTLWTPPR